MTEPADWTAIILAGGRGRRLGNVDKAALDISGTSSLDRLLAGLPAPVPVAVAGPARPTARPVAFRPESPPDGGPVAGLAAALAAVTTPVVALVATDMPWAGPLVTRLVAEFAADDEEALIPVDRGGRRQYLCSVWTTRALRRRLDRMGDPRGRAMREVAAGVRARDRLLTEQEEEEWIADIDTPLDLAVARRRRNGRRLDATNRSTQRGAGPMEEWIDAVRLELNLETPVDVDAILDVARVAAHNVARPAAPVTTFLLGIAVAQGADLATAARLIEGLAEGWAQPETSAPTES